MLAPEITYVLHTRCLVENYGEMFYMFIYNVCRHSLCNVPQVKVLKESAQQLSSAQPEKEEEIKDKLDEVLRQWDELKDKVCYYIISG